MCKKSGFVLWLLFQSGYFLPLISFINLSPGDGEVRQAWGILSMKVGVIVLRESAQNQGRDPREKKHDVILNVQLFRSKRRPQGQRWWISARSDTFSHHVSWQTLLMSYHTILIESIHNFWMFLKAHQVSTPNCSELVIKINLFAYSARGYS